MGMNYNDEQLKRAPNDVELNEQMHQARRTSVIDAIFTIRAYAPTHERQIGQVTGNTATAHLFASKVPVFRSPLHQLLDKTAEETVQHMAMDPAEELRLVNSSDILAKNDALAEAKDDFAALVDTIPHENMESTETLQADSLRQQISDIHDQLEQ